MTCKALYILFVDEYPQMKLGLLKDAYCESQITKACYSSELGVPESKMQSFYVCPPQINLSGYDVKWLTTR